MVNKLYEVDIELFDMQGNLVTNVPSLEEVISKAIMSEAARMPNIESCIVGTKDVSEDLEDVDCLNTECHVCKCC